MFWKPFQELALHVVNLTMSRGDVRAACPLKWYLTVKHVAEVPLCTVEVPFDKPVVFKS